jgi:hypothetical protein
MGHGCEEIQLEWEAEPLVYVVAIVVLFGLTAFVNVLTWESQP